MTPREKHRTKNGDDIPRISQVYNNLIPAPDGSRRTTSNFCTQTPTNHYRGPTKANLTYVTANELYTMSQLPQVVTQNDILMNKPLRDSFFIHWAGNPRSCRCGYYHFRILDCGHYQRFVIHCGATISPSGKTILCRTPPLHHRCDQYVIAGSVGLCTECGTRDVTQIGTSQPIKEEEEELCRRMRETTLR